MHGDRDIAKNLRRVRTFYTHRPDAFDVDAYLAGTAPFPTLLSRKLPEVFGGGERVKEKPTRPLVLLNCGYWTDAGMPLQDAQVALVREVARRAPNLRGALVLDVGSGYAGPAIVLAQEYGARVECVNVVAQQVAAARSLVERNGLGDRVHCHVADAMDLPFPDGAFDVVFCLEAAHSFADKPRFVAEAARVLRPGGTLLLADITTTSLSIFARRYPVLGVDLLRARDWRNLFVLNGLRVTAFESIGPRVWPVLERAADDRVDWAAGLRRAVAEIVRSEHTWPRRALRLSRLAAAVAEVALYLTTWRVWDLVAKRGVRNYVIFAARKLVTSG